MTKIAIAGSGAMGSRFGYMLQSAGNDVVLLDNWAEHVQAINTNGLTVVSAGHEPVQVRIPAALPTDIKEVQDVIILFTKSMQLEAMLQAIKPLIGAKTKVVCLLNGLGHPETIEQYLPKNNIFVGITLWTAGLTGPGAITLTGSGNVELQNVDPNGKEAAQALVALLSAAGLNAQYSSDVLFSIWRKACVNGTLNSLCALLDCNIAQLGQTPQVQQLLGPIVAEFSAVAATEAVELDVPTMVAYISKMFAPEQAGGHYPSMHQDLVQHHRLTEVDYLNGYVARKGAKQKIATPVNQLITELIHAKEALLIK
ncbi:2-dehydropantoate 2-reductase [Latilactobacillus graminis]|uniref:2-dehydropantoate 2-reductase n=2 Tax=Latilactobacillus graminis TaxID=60519 RepID=A0AA89I9E4_9LACO|nr:2-dehydropantoate 2-reductase [Latilactobacillus graminis]KRM24251.1 panE protein [Latilactobacillus graminis DSM 20719]QFP78769.1 2-dehydropantoate 2-reductase [Latilactobacillus graminis]